MVYKPIDSKSNVTEIRVTNEFGFVERYAVSVSTFIEPDIYEPESCVFCKRGIPEIKTDFSLVLKGIEKTKSAFSRGEIKKIIKTKNIIPKNIIYENFLLGFVYADGSNPNNHRWWLDFKDSNNKSIYNYFADRIEICCPAVTKSWQDPDRNGIWHGRFVFSNNDITAILEPDNGVLKINGDFKTGNNLLDTKRKRKSNTENIPDNAESLRVRYNTRENVWFCDILDKHEKEIGQINSKNIICNARMHGQVAMMEGKPKVSTRINVHDILDIASTINTLIIRGK